VTDQIGWGVAHVHQYEVIVVTDFARVERCATCGARQAIPLIDKDAPES